MGGGSVCSSCNWQTASEARARSRANWGRDNSGPNTPSNGTGLIILGIIILIFSLLIGGLTLVNVTNSLAVLLLCPEHLFL